MANPSQPSSNRSSLVPGDAGPHLARSVELARQQHPDVLDPQAVVQAVCLQTTDYVLIGGHAISILLQRARATVDVDLVVPGDQAHQIAQAICRSYPGLELVDFAALGRGDNLRLAIPGRTQDKDGDRIDLIKDHGVFALALKYRQRVRCGSGFLWVPSHEAAIGLKYAAIISSSRDAQDKEKDKMDFMALIVATNNMRLQSTILDEFANIALAGSGDYELRLAMATARRGRSPF